MHAVDQLLQLETMIITDNGQTTNISIHKLLQQLLPVQVKHKPKR